MPEAKPTSEAQENKETVSAKPAQAEPAPQPQPDASGEAASAGAATDGDRETAETGRVAELEAEVAQLKDQLLRALAEAENVRRRAQRERTDAIKYAAAPVVTDMLAVADNLSRALASLPDDAVAASEDERVATLIDGVRLTEKELDAVFERHGIVKLEPLGERLDPHRHEAMFEIPDPSQLSGTIIQVVQPGYMLHDRLLRPARVGVAKGGSTVQSDNGSQSEDGPPEPGSHVDTSA